MKYTCPRCGFESKKKSGMDKHLNRKKVCEPNIKDIDIKDKEVYNTIFSICNFCNVKYRDAEKHKLSCSSKAMLDKLEMLNKKIDTLTNQIEIKNNNTNTNTNNTNNTNNITINNTLNINLNNYNNYSIKHITPEMIFDYIQECDSTNSMDNLRTNFFEIIFYNHRAPENHIILYFKNGSRKHIYLHKNSNFEEISTEEFYKFVDSSVYDTCINLIKNFIVKDPLNLNDPEYIQDIQALLNDYIVKTRFNKREDHEDLIKIVDDNNELSENTHIDIYNQKKYKDRYPKILRTHIKNVEDSLD